MSPNAAGGGSCGVSDNKYSFTHGDQINFGDLTPYLTYGVSVADSCGGRRAATTPARTRVGRGPLMRTQRSSTASPAAGSRRERSGSCDSWRQRKYISHRRQSKKPCVLKVPWQTRSEADQENMGDTSKDNWKMAASKSFLKKVSAAFICLFEGLSHPELFS
jgi:hypothetical protein